MYFFFCVMSIAFFIKILLKNPLLKLILGFFSLFNRNSNKKQAKPRQDFSRFLNLLWEKKRLWSQIFFFFPSCGMSKKISTWNWSFVRAKFFCTTFSTTFALWTIFCWILSQWHWRMSLLLQNIWSFAENAKWLFG